MSAEDASSPENAIGSDMSAGPPPTTDWKARRDAFFSHSDGIEFFEQMNRRIALVVRPGCKNWEDESAGSDFQSAFDLITRRMLTVNGFANVMEKYAEYLDEYASGQRAAQTDGQLASGSRQALTRGDFMINRVGFVLEEWLSRRSNKPAKAESADEHIQTRATSMPAPEAFPLQELSLRIDAMKLQYRATLILWIWPLQCLPGEWRAKYLPVILEAGEKKGLPRDEVARRLEQVMSARQSVPEDKLLKAETKRGFHFESERHFNRRKRTHFGHLQRLEASGEFVCHNGVEASLTSDCYQAVKKTSEKAVREMFASDNSADRSTADRRNVRNPAWFHTRFCGSCYRQKYHRRTWLNAAIELLNLKPENGPMSHADIGRILNCPENTSYSNLHRARKTLLDHGTDDELTDGLERAATDDAKAQEAAFRQELNELQLHAFVCQDLKPRAG